MIDAVWLAVAAVIGLAWGLWEQFSEWRRLSRLACNYKETHHD